MSYLNSILASAGVSPIPVAPQPARKPAVQRSGGASSNGIHVEADAPNVTKRKASDSLTGPAPNVKRLAATTRPTENSDSPSRPLEVRNAIAVPKPDFLGAKKAIQRAPFVKPSTTVPRPPTGVSKPAASVASNTTAPGGKLSFAELIARGKALSSTNLGKTTGFVNKSTIAKSKEQLKESKQSKGIDARRGAAGKSKAKATSRSGSEDFSINKKAINAKAEKPKKKPVEVAYKGTMRPVAAPTAYRGTAKLNSGPRQSDRDDRRGYGRVPSGRDRQRERSPSYGYDDEEEEMYDSEGSSDMEAGAWDIDEEEDSALKAARREDAEALREEEEHKRKKAARKAEHARLGAAPNKRM